MCSAAPRRCWTGAVAGSSSPATTSRRPDPTCAPFEPVPCDVFITEATFGLPVFRHPPADAEIAKLLAFDRPLFPERAHVVGVYALGKAQRVIRLFARRRVGPSDLDPWRAAGPVRPLPGVGGRPGRAPPGDRGQEGRAGRPDRPQRRPRPSPTAGPGGCPTRWSRPPPAGCGCASAPSSGASNCRW